MTAAALILVAAVADNGVIGRGGALPWHLPADLQHFKRLTLGNTILMGRRTFESLGKPLPGRSNWVLTRGAGFAPPDEVRVFRDLDSVLALAPPELYVIGGADLYRQTLPLASRIELTEVHAAVDGDTCFPQFDRGHWREMMRTDHPADERNSIAFSFVTLASVRSL